MRVIVIGAGIAGLSAAAEIAAEHEVTVLEAETQPGYHSSGRSAATYIEPYINATVFALTRAGRSFFLDPPREFSEHALASPRADLMIADAASVGQVDEYLARWGGLCPGIREIAVKDALAQVSILRESAVARAVADPNVMDLDVHGLLEGFRRRLVARGGRLHVRSLVTAVQATSSGWRVSGETDHHECDVLVNAAGAWGDRIAQLAGVRPVGLVPKRRTAVLLSANGHDVAHWPIVHEVANRFYFKPDAGRLLLSPADETPSEPCDAQPDDWDVAVAVDRFQTATRLEVKRIEHKWAGLRSFVADNRPVVGYDPDASGFFWLVGQGGFGVQTSIGMSRLAASLVAARGVPADLAASGVTEAELAPARVQKVPGTK